MFYFQTAAGLGAVGSVQLSKLSIAGITSDRPIRDDNRCSDDNPTVIGCLPNGGQQYEAQ